jgi:outer membrane protein assembly factor BamB
MCCEVSGCQLSISTIKRTPLTKLALLALSCDLLLLGIARSHAAEADWPQWRGPLGTGAAPNADPPVEWSEAKNIRWKVALPGKGHSTPIIWGDRIFVTTAVPYGEELPPRHSRAPGTHDGVPVTHRHEFVVLAVNRHDGKVLWQKAVHQKLPHEGGHYTGSLASNSAVTDGEHVFAFFGSHGLYCLDMNGEVKWRQQLGEMQTKHGHGESASPVLHGDLLFVNWDHDGPCFVAAFDKRTGQQRWKVDRDEETSWSSPIIIENDNQPLLIVAGTNRVRAYDPATGKVIWECGGLSSNIVATPVAGDGMLFAGSSYEKRAFLAIRLDGAKGDITGSDRIAWTRNRGTPYVPSPLLYEDSLYFLTHYQGILSRVEAATGLDKPGAIRLGRMGNIYASPVAGGGRVYVTDLDGKTIVVSHDDRPKVLAVNILDEEFAASAAIVGRELFLRGKTHLYCIADDAGL